MKKYKQFIIGFLIGAMLFSTIGVYGEDIFNVIANPYPIVVNGITQDIQALNINGFTYMKLADAAKVLNSSVKFNEVTKEIEINTFESEVLSMTTTTTAAIEYDSKTGLPIGAEIIEYKRWKDAVRYNDNIYLSNVALTSSDIWVRSDVKTNTITIERDGSTTKIDIPTTQEDIFLNRYGRSYCNVNLFGL